MNSIRRQLTLLLICFIVILAAVLVTAAVWQIREKAVVAAVEKAKSDLNTFEVILDLKYPGQWYVDDGILYKGNTRINENNEIVDYINRLTGDTCTVFLLDKRVATTVRAVGGQRAIGTAASDVVKQVVLQNGGMYTGEADVIGEIYQAAYKPIRDSNSNIIGMIYVGAPHEFYRQLLYGTLKNLSFVIVCLIILFSVAIRLYVELKIVRPLRELTRDTREISAHPMQSVNPVIASGPSEIRELVKAFNQMVENFSDLRRQLLTPYVQEAAGKNEISPVPDKESPLAVEPTPSSDGPVPNEGSQSDKYLQSMLPKGLNQVTLNQVVAFMDQEDAYFTAEEVSEHINVTRVTAMRYLDFLVDQGHLKLDLRYGSVGRPVKIYKKKLKGAGQEN
ncbi:cache domain-containing protein [Desulfoscipio gibsoniae]|uniref:Response regulator of citrate/malate metabolism n=1 Tax=Desulfoscipio gibsoniae DSM 7213 TaxID=767817 RepID=R4KEL1_9FIRM|nr:cache domain-containing protein [Desulfoscipio gibsoniae]AGL01004.1 response regulator of citrate/malate metabolism [Desulfoscipio gibsoniae DSM 7213]